MKPFPLCGKSHVFEFVGCQANSADRGPQRRYLTPNVLHKL